MRVAYALHTLNFTLESVTRDKEVDFALFSWQASQMFSFRKN